MGIFTMHDLAHANYYQLKQNFGVLGTQLYAHSWGIDRSFLGQKYKVKSKSIGNSQVLNRDYTRRKEIEIVIKEMADQVATRLRRSGAKADFSMDRLFNGLCRSIRKSRISRANEGASNQ